MNREQTKYIKARLDERRRVKIDVVFHNPPLPKSVAAAKRVVDAWAEKQRQLSRDRRARVDQSYSKAYETMLAGDFAAALKALKEFERFRP